MKMPPARRGGLFSVPDILSLCHQQRCPSKRDI
jgi:hypothetical protein